MNYPTISATIGRIQDLAAQAKAADAEIRQLLEGRRVTLNEAINGVKPRKGTITYANMSDGRCVVKIRVDQMKDPDKALIDPQYRYIDRITLDPM